MRKLLFICFPLLCSMIALTHNHTYNSHDTSDNQYIMPFTQEDSVIIDGGWRSKYLESSLYIINKEYVVYQSYNTRKIIYPDITSFRIVSGMDECGVAVDKNGIYFQGIFIKTDTAGIKVIGCDNNYGTYTWLWKTKDKVFKNEKELSGIDAGSFQSIECLNGQYFKDKNSVYYFDKKIEGSDGSSVSKSCGEMCYDNNQVYVNGEIVYYKGKKVKPVNDALAKTDTEVIVISTMRPIPGIDAPSLTKLSRMYSMDKNHVYYGGTKTPVLRANLKNVKVWDQVNRAYVSDGIKVYSREGESGVPEGKLDAKTFGMLPHSDFCYDKDGVYEREWKEKQNKIVLDKFPFKYTESVTPENTFITDNSRYIVYRNQAYDPWDHEFYADLSNEQIQELKDGGFLSKVGENPENNKTEVISLGHYYTKKGNQIYMFRELLSEIQDANSFEPLSFSYSKDKDNIYFLRDEGYSHDKRRYSVKQISGADPHTFILNILSYDKDNVYIGDKTLISSADIEFLAIFSGYRPGCGMDRTPSTNYIFMKNKDGFWLVTTLYSLDEKQNIQYLGKTFSPKWNKIFEDFELPRGL